VTIARSPLDPVYDEFVKTAQENMWSAFHFGDWRDLEHTLAQTIAKAVVPDHFDEVLDAAEEWAKQRVGTLITNIDKATLAAVQRITARGIKHGWSDDEIASRLEKKVGLDGRFADAVENYRQGLVERGFAKGDASRMAHQRADEIRYNRALTIARTEVQTALVEGQRIVWKEALEVGDIDKRYRREWVLHPSEANCTVCKRMNGKRATIDGNYRSGTKMPAHPNCRCHERLVSPEGIIVKIDSAAMGRSLVERRIMKGKAA
jgi:putative heme iron utilization protein